MHAVTCTITFCSKKFCVNCLRLEYNDRLTTKNTLSDKTATQTAPRHEQQNINKLRNFYRANVCINKDLEFINTREHEKHMSI